MPISLNHNDLIFYDIECFKYDSLVVFKDINNREIAHFWSKDGKFPEPNGFEEIPNVVADKTLVGYNNYFYDDKMLEWMARGYPQKFLKKLNDDLISGDTKSDIQWDPFPSLDCMQQIDVSHPSLKQIEGNAGKSILESIIPFDIDRHLTDEEKEEVLRYCRYDVESTIFIYKLREHAYFHTKQKLVEMLGTEKAWRWNTTTISGNILLNQKLYTWEKLMIPERFWMNVKGIPESAWEMWKSVETNPEPITKKVILKAFDCEFVFGFGGLHGVYQGRKVFHDVKLLDVGSMYPSMIVLMEALGNATEKYDGIRQERLKIKHKDKLQSDALKLILNSVYGNLKNQYSILFNPLASTTVCVYGQIALFDLCRELFEAGYTLVNANTDGIAFCEEYPYIARDYNDIWHDWEEKWGMYLELDEFDKWIQKDVNNYIATKDGKIKVKGGLVNKYHYNPNKGVHKLFSNNSCRILQIALVDKIVFDKSPIDTLIENLDKPELFQYILKAGSTYKGVFDSDGNQMQKVNRVFACKEQVPHTKLYKKRQDDGLVNFPDAPNHMYVWNDEVSKLENFSEIVDLKHYLDVIYSNLKLWGVDVR